MPGNSDPAPNAHETLEKQMMQDIADAGITIIPGESVNIVGLPIHIQDYEKIPIHDQQFIEDVARVCQDYLNLQTLKDGFGSDHNGKRRPWRIQMSAKYKHTFNNFYQNDRMRLGNKIVPLIGNLDAVAHSTIMMPKNADVARIAALKNKLPDALTFDTLDTDGKLQFVANLANIAREYLGILYEKR